MASNPSDVGRPRSDLYQHYEIVSNLYKSGHTASQIAFELRERYEIRVSTSTLKRRLKEWKIPRKRLPRIEDPQVNELITSFYKFGCNDEEIYRVLQRKGYYGISLDGLRRSRRRLGLKRRIPAEEFETAKQHLMTIVQSELNAGTIEGLGIRHLYTYLWNRGHSISRSQ